MRGIVPATVLITLGVLFLIDEFTYIGFGRTWPIFLIALGIAIAVQRSLGPKNSAECCAPETAAPSSQEVKRG